MSEQLDRDAAFDLMAKLLQQPPPVQPIHKPLFTSAEIQQFRTYMREHPDVISGQAVEIALHKAEKAIKPPGFTETDLREILPKIMSEAMLEAEQRKSFKSDTSLGSTHDQKDARIRVSHTNRQSGMYVLGVQGVGKSLFLDSLIVQDMNAGFPVIVLDPHGDLIESVIAKIPEDRMKDTYLLDMLDEDYPFGVNIFAGTNQQTSIAQTQAVDRVMHIFAALWGEMLLSQRNLPLYLRLATIVLFANPGSTLVDLYYFLINEQFRERMLRNVPNRDVVQFWHDYNSMSKSAREKDIAPLLYRLQALFVGRSLISNIVGQTTTTIDFRRAIENKEIILIRLPTKILPQDAALIGTMLVAQIHAAIFSFADTPQERRPGFSLFVDEFQHFVTMDFVEMFTEGRKFGSRLTLAHQLRGQLRGEVGDIVKAATKSAYTKVVFRTTDEDAREVAEDFITLPTKVRPEDIEPHPVDYLLTYGHQHRQVARFVDQYLRPMDMRPKRFEIYHWDARYSGGQAATDFFLNMIGYTTKWPPDRPKVDNPLPYLDALLFKVEQKADWTLPLPFEVVLGFSDVGEGYFMALEKAKEDVIDSILTHPQAGELLASVKKKQEGMDDLADFLILLRTTMRVLARDPLGEKRGETKAETVQNILRLPNREAFVKIGTDIRHMRTIDMPANVFGLSSTHLKRRQTAIRDQTRARYCAPKDQVEQERIQRLEAGDFKETTEEVTTTVKEAEPEPLQAPSPATRLSEPVQSLPQQPPTSLDTMNTLYALLKARVIDPDTTILAALGEHYVMTIKQWMRLFEWGSYPRATQYFKELRDVGLIYRKDREGRGGQLVEGDWFFLLTRGANELMKRKQTEPLFTLEPNEAERSSGDTLVHTYLVNDLLIHLRLLEREQPETVRIEQIDHERSMRRAFLTALQDSKLYPDGYLRLLVPTANGLKRRYMFLELQHTTQWDEANWKAKCRKYLALFEQETVLERFFATRIPSVLVITINPEYVPYHKRWTAEVLEEARERGRAYSSRFLIGSYDTGISDMSVLPQQFFCEPRFFTPIHDAPRSLFGT